MYQNVSGSIGNLLRLIKEDQSTNPATISPAAEVGSPVRQTVATPLLPVESPNSSMTTNLRPEGVVSPGAPQATTQNPVVSGSRIGPISIGGGEEFAAPTTALSQTPTVGPRQAAPGQIRPVSVSTPTETLRVVSPVERAEPSVSTQSPGSPTPSPRNESSTPTVRATVQSKPRGQVLGTSISMTPQFTPQQALAERQNIEQQSTEAGQLLDQAASIDRQLPEYLRSGVGATPTPIPPKSQTVKVSQPKQSLATQIWNFITGRR